tara:strand:- start:2927 stop:3448 length:522 start_codon:yes stop_codon:yes gene_type:complete
MNLKSGAIKILEYSIYVLLISMVIEKIRFNRNPSYRVVFRFLHYYVLITLVSFVFLIDKEYDYAYLIAVYLMNLSWEFNENRCLLSDYETINEKEKSNSYHPYFEIFVGKHTDPVVMLQLALMLYNFYVIYKRQTMPIYKIFSVGLGILISYKLLRSRFVRMGNYLKSKGILE